MRGLLLTCHLGLRTICFTRFRMMVMGLEKGVESVKVFGYETA